MMHQLLLVALCMIWGCLAAPPYPSLDVWDPASMEAFLDEARQASALETRPEEDNNFNTGRLGLGTVSAVGIDSKGDLFIFHRADRPWIESTFGTYTGRELTPEARAPITKDTIVKVSADDASFISSFGKDFFNVPHGLTVDSNDNIWVTDVGRHQVFRFPKNATKPDLTLGEQFVPGDDTSHFCKPTDVAIASTGEFFVSDGYCNSRVLKFSKNGTFMEQWGIPVTNGQLTPFTLNLPHSITLIEKRDLVCVADRQNQRALCYNAGLNNGLAAGSFNRTLVPRGEIGAVFAISYSSADDTVIAASSQVPYVQGGTVVYPARAYTYSVAGLELEEWAYVTPNTARYGPSLIHDLCASHDGRHYYLADLSQRRVVRFTRRATAQPDLFRNW